MVKAMRIFLQQMMRILLMCILVLCMQFASAQTDSLNRNTSIQSPTDTIRNLQPEQVFDKVDSLAPNTRRDTVLVARTLMQPGDSDYYKSHPFFGFANPTRYTISVRQWEGKEAIFYVLIALLIFFALVRNGFSRYLNDLFKTYFRTTVRQRQVKDQLLQNPLPSLLLNIFFLLSIGLYLALLLQYFGLGEQFHFWFLFLYCVLGLVFMYGLKFLSLSLMGWILQVKDAISTYIFIVFSTNKVIGIALLPFLFVLAFSGGFVKEMVFNLSFVVVLGLFAYRFFLSYVSLQRQIRVSFFHFLLYLMAFEVAPLLLINKLLFTILR
jgi:hypothetical protein